MLELENFIHEINSDSFLGTLTESYYDLALYVYLDINSSIKPLAHRALKMKLICIYDKQLTDGSWDNEPKAGFIPNKITNTLALLLAFQKLGVLEDVKRDRAIRFLSENIEDSLNTDAAILPIGYKVILKVLLILLNKESIHIPYELNEITGLSLSKIVNIYNEKLTIHSILEVLLLDKYIKWEKFISIQEADGSMGIFPSSTIAMMSKVDPTSKLYSNGLKYIENMYLYNNKFVPFFPSNLFERWWSNLALLDSPLKDQVTKVLVHYNQDFTSKEMPVTESFSLSDIDTTSVYLSSLLIMGYSVDLRNIMRFYKNGLFQCYERESRISASANIHALQTIFLAQKYSVYDDNCEIQSAIYNSLDYLFDLLDKELLIKDKWHLSELYSTSLLLDIFALVLNGNTSTKDKYVVKIKKYTDGIISLLLDMQKPDSGWSVLKASTVEETSYVTKALLKHNISIPKKRQLLDMLSTEGLSPDLWIGKTLYSSEAIIKAHSLSAHAYLLP